MSVATGTRRWRTRAVRVGTGVAIAAVIVGGGVAAYAEHGNGPDEYRTAVAALGDVDQTLALSGTVDPSGRSDLVFGSAGTVSTLAVGVGDKVIRGQVLARLDTTGLKAAVTRANAQLAAARAQLATDEDAQASSVSATSAGTGAVGSGGTTKTSTQAPTKTSATAPPTGSSGGASSSQSTKALAQLAQQQKAVEVAQTAVDTAIDAAQDATEQERTDCSSAPNTTADPSTGASGDASASASADPSADLGADSGADSGADRAGGSDAETGAASTACAAAVATVQAAQQRVADAEYAAPGNLKDALGALAGTLSGAAKAAGSSASTGHAAQGSTKAPTQGSTQGSTKAPTAASTKAATGSATEQPSLAGGRTGGQSVTAATLAKDQASIDSARAGLIKASQALTGATIKAPTTGTVGQVSISRGGSVGAGSTAIVVIAPGTTTVALNVSSTQVAQLKVGQKASVTPAGASRAYPGTVTRIGQLPTSSGSGSSSASASTYPVTVTLADRGLDLLAGATAAVDVTLGSATHVVTVPTSAVSNGSVEVYADGRATRTRVTTGLVGRTRTVITQGLEAGQQVVLADLSTALPTGGTNAATRGFPVSGLGRRG